jgi:hypothetical protein
MDNKLRTLQALKSHGAALAARKCFVGFDGFVDTIVSAVDQRAGQGENFTPFATLGEFGKRIVDAGGKSTNIELYPRMDKLGGNGPIMAGALLAQSPAVTCVGALGSGPVHPVFSDLATRGRAVSLCESAHTIAVEFTDGKVMLGMMRSLDQITPRNIEAALGGAAGYRASLDVDLVALVNWTMIPNMSAIFLDLIENVLPASPPRPDRIFFFDLADPEKRTRADLTGALSILGRFEKHGRVTLGLNLKEAQQVFNALGFGVETEAERGLRAMASRIRGELGVSTVVIHPKESAACATSAGTWWVPGPYAAQPLITTGAGDHFNAGFSSGQLMGLDPESCLYLGVSTSGHYVRTARSPTLADLETFLANWHG